jgi:tetratricopeptide (TPR) repeat protein
MPKLFVLALTCLLLAPGRAHADDNKVEPDRKDVEAFFLELGGLVAKNDRSAIARLFDTELVIETIEKGGFLRAMKPEQQAGFKAEMRKSLQTQLAAQQIVAPFASFEVLRILEAGAPDRRLVFVRLRDQDNWAANYRWWLVKRGDAWKVFDFEDLDVPMRFTALTGASAVARATKRTGFAEAMLLLQTGVGAIEQQSFDEAWEVLSNIKSGEIPRVLESVRQMLLGMIHMNLEQTDAALRRFETAEQLNQDMVVLDRLRAVVMNRSRRHQQALAYAQRYTSRVGLDAQIQLEIGKAQIGLGNTDAAIKAYEAGLEDSPDEPELIARYAMALIPGRKPEAIDHYRKMYRPAAHFEYIADLVAENRDAVTLRLFNRAFAALSPGHAIVDFYEARALEIEGRLPQALKMYDRALRKVKDPQVLRGYLEPWLDAMLASGKIVEAFNTSPDAGFALRHLGWDLSRANRPDQLRELVRAAAKAAKNPRPPEVDFFNYEVEFLLERYEPILKPYARLRLQLIEKTKADPRSTRYWELLWETEDRLIRCLTRLRRFDIAAQYAQQIEERDKDPMFRGFVAALAGKPTLAIPWLDQSMAKRLDPNLIFDDEDLSKTLSGPAYARLRKKYGRE